MPDRSLLTTRGLTRQSRPNGVATAPLVFSSGGLSHWLRLCTPAIQLPLRASSRCMGDRAAASLRVEVAAFVSYRSLFGTFRRATSIANVCKVAVHVH